MINIHPIFIFILIITSNFLAELFPCRIQNILKENIFIKHICGFLTLLFFAVLVDPIKQTNFNNMLLSSAFLYFIFIILCNTNVYFFITSLIVIGILYILNLKKVEINAALSETEEVDKSHQMNTITLIEYANKILIFVFSISTTIGFFIYMGEKKIEYGKQFNYFTFLLGKSSCKNYSTDSKWSKSLKAAFFL